MRVARHRLAALFIVLVAVPLLAAGCGDGEGNDTASGTSGDVFITGSSTVEPISARVAELLNDVEPDVSVTVEGPGTGDGFEAFCNGEAEITDASRTIKEEEAAACDEKGIEFIELQVAFDGISVLTHPDNDAVDCLTFADLYALIGPEAEGFGDWSDAADLAGELGSDTELPDAALDIIAPGEESGTYDSFVELAFKDIAEARVAAGEITEDEAETSRPDYTSQADDNAIIQGIEGSDTSLGWVGFAFAERAGDEVKELAVDAGDGCVEPTAEAIADGTYPLSRPLFIYVNAAEADANPAVAAYVDFYLGDGVSAVEEVGYVALPDDRLQASIEAWEERLTGSSQPSE